MAPLKTAIGCRVKSGWGMSVLLAGPLGTPRVLDRRRIELSDPAVPETIQPYHAAFGTERTDAAAIRRLSRIVARCTQRSLAEVLGAYRGMGHHPRRLGIVVGSLVDPRSIANQHVRAHAQEGRLFRRALEAAAKQCRLRSTVIVERELYVEAARRLGCSPEDVHRVVTNLGRAVGRPWRSEHKVAATAAWLVLASSDRGRR
jgi:hypothetical protein